MTTSFIVNLADLTKILEQIKIAEAHAAGGNLIDIIGQDSALLPFGLRTVDGSFNHLLPGQELAGAADQLFPRLTTAEYVTGSGGPFGPVTNNNYDPSIPGSHSVVDAEPRTISNLIVDQTLGNLAAVSAALAQAGATDPFGDARALQAIADPVARLAAARAAGLDISEDGSITVENRSPDIGLSPSNSGWMTLFGQFFDHGLDLVTKGGPGTGTVFIPLNVDDPLFDAGLDGNPLTLEDNGPNFMAVTRTTRTELAGADGILVDDISTAVNEAADNTFEAENTTTPFVDQNQTYTSHASHQVFLREYVTVGGRSVATGKLLEGANGGIANWAEVKQQAIDKLGISLSDFDVHNVPLLRTDAYGKFIPDPTTGFAQLIVGLGVDGIANTADDVVRVGTALAPIDPTSEGALRTGHAFLNDIAHHAAPSAGQTADTDPGVTDDGIASTYDDEMLNAHFITGDGRGNENIGLSAVHFIFHAEHNRLVDENKATLLASGDLAVINEWLAVDLTDLTGLPADLTDRAAVDAFAATLTWDGERLFQAARFVTEMQYQHLVFEEFARRIQPNVDPFVFTNSADLDPAILAEFAHAVYRFGHSMLTDTVDRLDNNLDLVNGDTDQIGLIEAFLNPQAFTASSGGLTDDIAAGAIIRGMSRQVGNEIDEFVVEALRNNLVGLPLDLAAINMARGREAGIATLNHARTELYDMTGDAQLKPYTSWLDFAQNIKNPLSVVNFIAAYGTHAAITAETTLEGKRAVALEMVLGVDANNVASTIAGRVEFLNGPAATSGVDDIDLWVGGLAEELMEFGGMLGSTFNAIFEYQMEHLQNGDRFYYLSRTQGMNLLNLLEPNTFADIIMRNTDLGDLHATHLVAEIMEVADLILELDPLVAQNNGDLGSADPTHDDSFLQIIDPKVVRSLGTTDIDGNGFVDGNVLKFSGGEHVVLGGTEGNDTLIGDKGIDTLWGDGGDDYLNAGMESDQVFGGDGDDIIEDPFGDDFLRGEAGNDVIVDGHGLDLLFGGEGQDFLMGVTDTKEVFAGPGNDFILGGSAPDVLLGNEGDDWIEGGEGFDGLSGENSELFFNSAIVGHDILNGQGNDTDYDAENGDDIMVQSAGIQRNNGMDGFDWAIHKGDANAADSDLGIRVFDARQALILRDRFDSVEGLSGWEKDDILTGAAKPLLGENFADALTQASVDRIDGMREFLGDVANGPGVGDVVFESDTNIGGEIILGGAGSDTITGNLGNDILDGDAWLNVRIAVMQNKDGTGSELFTVDSLTEIQTRLRSGEINPGQLKAVREILNSDGSKVSNTLGSTNDGVIVAGVFSGDVDIAVFQDARSNYEIEGFVDDGLGNVSVADLDGDGFITVTHL
ncbi:MAG: peroxidase family protein, partial [Hyphomicrobium sp.]